MAVVFDHALERDERFRLSHWDSLLLAACADAGVTRINSEDRQHEVDRAGQVVESLDPGFNSVESSTHHVD
jgi:predicted nucleic acid-binding protein